MFLTQWPKFHAGWRIPLGSTWRLVGTLVFLTIGVLTADRAASAAETAPYQTDGEIGAPAEFGVSRLQARLADKSVTLRLAGSSDAAPRILVATYETSKKIRSLVDDGKLDLKKSKESLAVTRLEVDGKNTLVIAGFDTVGLMYALLDMADAAEHASAGEVEGWPKKVAERSESPENSMRRMRILMHHKANEDWYRSKEFWDWYIGMLATNRFNGLNMVYSHQTSYMAPMYAWHVKVDEFPNVKPNDITEEEREHNLEILKYVSRTCRDRGIELTIGVWQHLPWKESYLVSRDDQASYVDGLDHTNVAGYTYLAVKKLLAECPGIARIQIRPNDESGIHLDDQTKFYRDSVMRAIKDSPGDVKLDLRTVGVRQSTIEAARAADLDVRTSLKYYGEFLAMPFTPIEAMTKGYSYSDYLEKPLANPIYNEIWMLGSHRVLLWGSEDYGRRFGRNASYSQTFGFETDGPNAQKGFRDPHSPEWRMFKHKEDEYYTHEFERYWAFYRTIGRFSYNPDADHDVWARPFRSRFGGAAEAMTEAYEQASQVIGLICASHVSNVNMYIWPEINMGGVLPVYMDLRGTDKTMFPSINDQIRDEMAGARTPYLGAWRTADKFDQIAVAIEQALDKADAKTDKPSKEYRTTKRDFMILADLARYHAYREREGYLMAKYLATGDGSLLPATRQECQGAIDAWKRLVKIADYQYYDHFMTGMVENGHWKEKTFLIESNLKYIDQATDLLHTHGVFDFGFDFGGASLTNRSPIFYPQATRNQYWNAPRFTGLNARSDYDAARGFGFTQHEGLKDRRMAEVGIGNLTGVQPDPKGPLALDLLHRDFVYSGKPFRFRLDLWPMDTYRFTLVMADHNEHAKDHGGINISGVGRHWNEELFKDVKAPAGQIVVRQSTRRLRRNWYPFWEFEFSPSGEGADAMLSGLTVHRDGPNLAHARPTRIDPRLANSLLVTITMPPKARGNDPSNISASSRDRLRSASLFYRTQAGAEFKRTDLATGDGFVYSASIETSKDDEGTLQYYFQAMDKRGRVVQLPKPSAGQPYFQVPLTDDAEPPKLTHKAIKQWPAGNAMPIEVAASDPSGVQSVRVRFRPLKQSFPYQSITLERKGDRFVGVIPESAVWGNYDFVYYFEAVDNCGNGTIYPNWEKTNPYVIVETVKGEQSE